MFVDRAVMIVASVFLFLAPVAAGAVAASSAPAPPASSTVTGTILDAGGDALAGARIELVPLLSSYEAGRRRLEGQPDPRPVATAASDPAGRFRLQAGSGMFRLVVGAKGHLPMQYLPFVASGASELPPVRLKRSRQVSVVLQDAAGRGAAGVWVFVQAAGESRTSRSPWRPDFRVGRTDGSGRLLVPRRDGEKLEVTAFPADAPSTTWRDLPDGPLVLPAKAGRIRTLRVVDARGEPVAGALVRLGELSWPRAVTAADGLVRWLETDAETNVYVLTADGRRKTLRLAPPDGEESTEVVLADVVTVHGRVLATGNRPLAGAVVWPGIDPGAFVRTDGEGRYTIVAPLGERFWFQAEAVGHVPRLVRPSAAQLAGRRLPTLSLEPAAVIAGRVTNPAGDKVAGVLIAALPRGYLGPRPFTAPDPADGRDLSGSDGDFALNRLQPGESYTLIASRPGYVTVTATAFAPRSSEAAPRLDIVLPPGRAAVGRVVDPEDRPIEGAQVRLFIHGVSPRASALSGLEAGEKENPFQASADAEGHFRVAAVPATKLDVTIAAQGFAPMTVRQLPVALGEGPVDLGTFVLVPGAAITGKVLDADERPVAGAAVHALDEERSERTLHNPGRVLRLGLRRPETVTGEDGTFTVEDLPVGSRRGLWIRAEGFLPANVQGAMAPNAKPFLVTLERARSLAGRVVDEDDAPIAGARLDLSWQDTLPETEGEIPVGAPEARSALSDDDGFFELTGIRPGPVSLSAFAERFVVPEEALEIEIPEKDEIEDLTLVLKRGAVVTGTVLTSDSEPVTGVRILAGGSGAFTDAEGFYRLEGARLGPDEARSYHSDYGRFLQEIEVEPGVNLLDWTLPAGLEVGGRVVDPGGEPVPDAELQLSLRGTFEPRTYYVRASADGSFLFATVARGDYTLAVEAAGYAAVEYGEAVAVANAPIENLEITLEHGAILEGQILGLDFEQLGQVRVAAEGGRILRNGRVDYQGRYEIADLGPGSWLVTATLNAGRRQARARVSLPPGARQATQDLVFGGHMLSGRVLYDGEPLSGASVSLRGYQATSKRSGTTDHGGEFRFADLEPGEYWLGLTHHRKLTVHNEVIELAGDRDMVIDLRPTAVRGTVLEAGSFRPLLDARVVIVPHGHGLGRLGSNTDGEGRFVIPRVNAGRYQVDVEKDGYAPLRSEIEIFAGQDVDLEFELNPTQGLELQVSLATGQPPPGVKLLVLASDGGILLAETRPVTAEGSVRLPTVPPGRWEILVSAPGGGLSAVWATVPSEPLSLVLPPAGRMQVRVPELESSTLIASLSLLDANGEPLRGIDLAARNFRDRWQLVGGATEVDAVPAGLWTLLVEAPDGRTWSKTVVTSGADATVVLD